jgi:hypothetical protein
VKPWQQILDDFGTRLGGWAPTCGLTTDWPLWTDQRNVFPWYNTRVLSQNGTELLLHVKVRSSGRGFWALRPRRLDALRNSGRKWVLILLVGSAETGYMLRSAEVDYCTSSGVWALAKDGSFKLNEARVSKEFYFRSFDELAQRLRSAVVTEQ